VSDDGNNDRVGGEGGVKRKRSPSAYRLYVVTGDDGSFVLNPMPNAPSFRGPAAAAEYAKKQTEVQGMIECHRVAWRRELVLQSVLRFK
jgi:hypothetical protein